MSITVHYDKCELEVIDPQTIDSDIHGEREDKLISLIVNKKINSVFLKWKGKINGIPCVGCELKNKVNCGTNGMFGNQKLFDCADKRGVLIILNDFIDTCVNGRHRDISKDRQDIIEKDLICCIVSLESLTKYHKYHIGDKINKTFKNESKSGICQWIGLINGIESVGVEMDSPQKNGTSGTFNGFHLFQCQGKRGVLFKAEDL